MDPIELHNFLVDARRVLDGVVDNLNAERPTLRDRFAMAAMQGLISSTAPGESYFYDPLAGEAYAIADAMLEARKPKDEVG